MSKSFNKWDSGEAYDSFMGRWSKLVAPEFLKWLDLPGHLSWLDIGCGTGVLSEAILDHCTPSEILSVDPTEAFLELAKERLPVGSRIMTGNASNIPVTDEKFDVITSGLALNFFPDLQNALSEMKRVAKPKGIITAYVWEYPERMDFLRYFWDTVFQVDPESLKLKEGIHFPVCNAESLSASFREAGLIDIATNIIVIDTDFICFDDYWTPFFGGQGPAAGYLVSLSNELQTEIKIQVRSKLPFEADGSIKMNAKALAIRGTLR